jgi:phenylpyruvate tautomerase PptA (4-oxalocrotonate tautomerase family)
VPMIDVYAPPGALADKHELARQLAAAIMQIEKVPDIAMFRENTAAVIHELPRDAIANVDGKSDFVRVQVLTNAGGLDRGKQLTLVSRLTALIANAAGNPPPPERIWVLLTEAVDGGWGLWGHVHTNEELTTAARREMAAAAEAAQLSGMGKPPTRRAPTDNGAAVRTRCTSQSPRLQRLSSDLT